MLIMNYIIWLIYVLVEVCLVEIIKLMEANTVLIMWSMTLFSLAYPFDVLARVFHFVFKLHSLMWKFESIINLVCEYYKILPLPSLGWLFSMDLLLLLNICHENCVFTRHRFWRINFFFLTYIKSDLRFFWNWNYLIPLKKYPNTNGPFWIYILN